MEPDPPDDLLSEVAELASDLRELLRAEQNRGVGTFPPAPDAMRRAAESLPAPLAGPARPPERPPARPVAPAMETRRPAPPGPERRAEAPRPAVPPRPVDPAVLPLLPEGGAWGRFAAEVPEALSAEQLAAVTGAWGFRSGGPVVPPNSRAEEAARALHAIRAELGDCTRCRLAAGRNQLVFGMGDPGADLAIVGEGPGFHEDKQGLPFVGASGEMLDRMLENVLGLARERVYILNVVKCRPPENRTPLEDEVATCSPFLVRQLQAIQPKVILALGAPAAKTLLGRSDGINALRGRWHAWSSSRTPLLATFHPAYLLRKPEDKGKTLADLKMLRTRYDELGGRR